MQSPTTLGLASVSLNPRPIAIDNLRQQHSNSPQQQKLSRAPRPRDHSFSQHQPPNTNSRREPESALKALSLEDDSKKRQPQLSEPPRYTVKRVHHDGDQPYPHKHCRSSASPFSSPNNQNPSGSFRTHSPPHAIPSSHRTAPSSPQMPFSQTTRSTQPTSVQTSHQVSLAALREFERAHPPSTLTPNVVYDPTPEQDIGILPQPETRPITQAQLVNEVKGIYAGLVMVEKKCVEICLQQSQTDTKLSNQQWQALIALHRTLLHEHHDFFLASQHPTASVALRRLPTKYAMPARMWRHGIHSFLELLRHRLPDSIEHMMSFVYLAYQMMGLLMESVPVFYETWIECLGDLARYRMAIEEADMRDREIWSNVARMWYNRAADRSPNTGRIQHHLAVLARPHVIRQLFYYSKSLISVFPFVNARDSIMLLFTQFLEPDTASLKYTKIETSLVSAAALVFTRGSIHQYIVHMLDFTQELEVQITNSGSNFKVLGPEIASSLAAMIFDIGNDENYLFNAVRAHQNKLRTNVDDKPQATNVENAPVEDPRLKETIRREYWHQLGTSQGQDTSVTHAQPHGGDRPDAKFESSDQVSSYVLPVWCSCISTVANKVGDRNVLPFIHVTLAFIWSLSYIPGALVHVEQYIPWDSIILCLNTLSRSGVSDLRVESEEFPQQQSGTGLQLPEDFVIRGLVWAPYYFPEDFFKVSTVDEDERTLELPSHSAPRVERCLWLGHKISTVGLGHVVKSNIRELNNTGEPLHRLQCSNQGIFAGGIGRLFDQNSCFESTAPATEELTSVRLTGAVLLIGYLYQQHRPWQAHRSRLE